MMDKNLIWNFEALNVQPFNSVFQLNNYNSPNYMVSESTIWAQRACRLSRDTIYSVAYLIHNGTF